MKTGLLDYWTRVNMLSTRLLPLLLVAVFYVRKCIAREPTDLTKLYYFYGPNYFDHKIFNYNELEAIVQDEKFDANRTTTLYIHGYNENMGSDTIHRIVNAYLSRKEHNIIVLDWSDAASGNYFINAVPNSLTLGNLLASVVLSAFKNGLDSEKFHIVGHSLGAQMAGMIGRKIITQSNQSQKLKRITGLDPAFPSFFPSFFIDHLSHSDAEFVDIIHTDAGLYGQPYSTGTVDFWPNDGMTLQPGCPYRLGIPLTENDLCSHQRSVAYYSESVALARGNTFLSASARSWSRFKNNDSNSTNVVNMGVDCSSSAYGDYYLQTNSEPPYSRGVNGLRYLN